MGNENNTLWALIAASLLLVASVGLVLIVEGSTRRRIVSSGSARHIAGVVGAVLGVFVCGYALGAGSGGALFGREGFFLENLDLASRSVLNAPTQGALIVHAMGAGIVFSTIVSAALAERGTFIAHLVLGFLSGGVLVPLLTRALRSEGLLGSISFNGSPFTAGAAPLFAFAGWFGLVGAMIIGPRLGRVGSTGDFRAITGKSTAMVSAGALTFLAGAIGFASLPSPVWVDELGSALLALMLSGAASALVAALLGYRSAGVVGGDVVMRGLVAGVVAATGAPFEIMPVHAIVVGATAAGLIVLASNTLERAKIDDPVGVISSIGVAAVWGSITAGGFRLDQGLAQLVGQMIIAAVAIVTAGVFFAGLRGLGLLRIRRDVELVGLNE